MQTRKIEETDQRCRMPWKLQHRNALRTEGHFTWCDIIVNLARDPGRVAPTGMLDRCGSGRGPSCPSEPSSARDGR
eukprot:9493531-Lingulodinium_polyedra.AAC.1